MVISVFIARSVLGNKVGQVGCFSNSWECQGHTTSAGREKVGVTEVRKWEFKITSCI